MARELIRRQLRQEGCRRPEGQGRPGPTRVLSGATGAKPPEPQKAVAPSCLDSFLQINQGLHAQHAWSPSSFPSPMGEVPVYVCELTKRKYRGKQPKVI